MNKMKKMKKMEIIFKKLEIETLAPEIQEWYESMKDKNYQGYTNTDNELLILITLGEKNCGGYSVAINDIKLDKNKLFVNYEIEEPTDTDAMITSFSYPYEIVSIEKQDVANVLNLSDIEITFKSKRKKHD